MTDSVNKEDAPDSQEFLSKTKRDLAIAELKSGELKWKEYIDSWTPEQLER